MRVAIGGPPRTGEKQHGCRGRHQSQRMRVDRGRQRADEAVGVQRREQLAAGRTHHDGDVGHSRLDDPRQLLAQRLHRVGVDRLLEEQIVRLRPVDRLGVAASRPRDRRGGGGGRRGGRRDGGRGRRLGRRWSGDLAARRERQQRASQQHQRATAAESGFWVRGETAAPFPSDVIPGPRIKSGDDPGIHAAPARWIAGSSPAMTENGSVILRRALGGVIVRRTG